MFSLSRYIILDVQFLLNTFCSVFDRANITEKENISSIQRMLNSI